MIVAFAFKGRKNTNTHKTELEKNYISKKFHVVRNSFDETNYNNKNLRHYDPFTISHVGSMYGLRNADVLFRAIKLLDKGLHENNLNLRVKFVGLNDDYHY